MEDNLWKNLPKSFGVILTGLVLLKVHATHEPVLRTKVLHVSQIKGRPTVVFAILGLNPVVPSIFSWLFDDETNSVSLIPEDNVLDIV